MTHAEFVVYKQVRGLRFALIALKHHYIRMNDDKNLMLIIKRIQHLTDVDPYR